MSAALKQKDINFYKVYFEKPDRTAAEKQKSRIIAIPIILALALAGTYGYFTYKLYNINAELRPATQFLEGAAEREMLAVAQKAEKELGTAHAEYNNLQLAIDSINSYPVITKEMLQTINAAFEGDATISNMSFDNESAAIVLSAAASGVTKAADCVERLRQTDMFSSLTYYGYYSTEGETEGEKAKAYTFEVTGILKAVAADE